MTPREPPALPGNLSRQALKDFARILRHSRKHFVRQTTLNTEARLLARFLAIEQGLATGHRRPDLDDTGRTLFLNELPWVIAFDPSTRQVLRVVHGARDMPTLTL